MLNSAFVLLLLVSLISPPKVPARCELVKAVTMKIVNPYWAWAFIAGPVADDEVPAVKPSFSVRTRKEFFARVRRVLEERRGAFGFTAPKAWRVWFREMHAVPADEWMEIVCSDRGKDELKTVSCKVLWAGSNSEKAVSEAVSEVERAQGVPEKIVLLLGWLRAHAREAKEQSLFSPETHAASCVGSSLGCFCDGFSRFAVRVLRRVGISSYMVIGTLNGEKHAWVKVCPDSNCFYTDFTAGYDRAFMSDDELKRFGYRLYSHEAGVATANRRW